MKIVVGLGNPGKQYEATRHNVGFDTLRLLAEQFSAETPKSKFDSYVTEAMVNGERTLLVWPQTFMNRSGQAVRQVVQFYKTPLEDLLVICDDFALDVGRLRIRAKGSSGGQNGLKDVAQQLATEDYQRLRIGVGPVPSGRNAADFVLGRFASKERELVEVAIADAAAAVACWAEAGVTEAMNKFNGAGS
ncbi:Peptidyl-tRNA hydrolase [Botrimarina colliarenosi]|uniref:Peptidyl-tRNA hydrolase n=1 Tax=Botrimarina colliarenosi TaxID=2528001 RepID=A0A5C6A7P0_9BACT|nr:aminoacyl-tRNA hydrolase [Botrimarina colliarenosi]TWT95335.1 Peptidyl-tRNA hydrolase [Botrimarina colliarenosi]